MNYIAHINVESSLIAAMRDRLCDILSPGRYAHSLSAARTAADICSDHSLDPEKGYIAGLLHDLAREMPDESIITLSREAGKPNSGNNRTPAVLLHGVAGSVLAERYFGINDRDILQAIADHVTGRPGMGDLSKAVFTADYLEPERGFLDESLRMEVLRWSLNKMTAFVIRETLSHLRSQHAVIAEASILLYDEVSNRE